MIPVHKFSFPELLSLLACVRCKECVSYCPTYSVTSEEILTPQKKIKSLLGYFLKSRITTPSKREEEELAEAFYKCTVCAQCKVVCPAGLDTPYLWEKIRSIFVDEGLGPLEPQKAISQSIRNYDNPWMQPRSTRRRWADRAFREKKVSKPVPDIRKNRAKVLYFVGCTASYDQNIREIAINFVELMNRAGIEFGILGPEEKCCGSTPLRIGDVETFERQARENIKRFHELGVDLVVFSCSGCYKTISQDYPMVEKLNFKTLHMVQFILELIEDKKIVLEKEVPIRVTYHDPCHIGRHSGLFEEPRAILKSIPSVELIEMELVEKFSRCCGAGGGVKAGFPDVNNALTDERIREAERTGAEHLVTACPFCYQSFVLGKGRIGSQLHIRDITELVMESLK